MGSKPTSAAPGPTGQAARSGLRSGSGSGDVTTVSAEREWGARRGGIFRAASGGALAKRSPTLAAPGGAGAERPATLAASSAALPKRPATLTGNISTTPAVRTGDTPLAPGTPTGATLPVPATRQAAEQAWRTSVAARPLETPRPLPERFRPLARVLTGRPGTRFTTGPATRAALAAAGAVGATSGSVVHLPGAPEHTEPHVLAHELAHLRTIVARPRFLRPGASPSSDVEEQRVAQVTPTRDAEQRNPMAPVVGRLPVAGTAGLPNLVRAAGVQNQTEGRATPGVPVGVGAEAVQEETMSGSGTGPRTRVPQAPDPGVREGGEAPLNLDALLDALETRLLADLERRGGRFEGVF